MGTEPTNRRVPPDVAALLRKRKAEEELASKPRFIPKKERERLEAEKKAKEEEARRRQEEELKKKEEEFQRAIKNGLSGTNGANGMDGVDNKAKSQRDIPTGPKAMRHGECGKRGRTNEEEQKRAEMERNDEAELRARYMGPEVNQSTFSVKKKRRRTATQKFNFDWDPDDDTSRPFDPIYAERPDPLFRMAGYEMDDELVLRKAEAIRRGDPETGEERARKLLEQHQRVKQLKEQKNLEIGRASCRERV